MESYTLESERRFLHCKSERRKAFKDMHAGMNQGFDGTLDRLENYLKLFRTWFTI